MQWHTPMGYNIRDGQIVVDERQSSIVRQIFIDYDRGISAVQIAKTLIDNGVPNKNGQMKWTHATVGRILENYNYLGTEYYPQLIDTELFTRVQKLREQKRQKLSRGKYRPNKQETILFSGVIRCGVCGEPYAHHAPKKEHQEAKWKCKNYVYHNQLCCAGGFISDNEVMEVCVKVINQILQDKELIYHTPEERDTVTPRYSQLDKMISRMSDEGYEKMSVIMLDRAAERYLTLKVRDVDERTEFMMEAIGETSKLETFDEELYRKLIKEIIVNKDSTATVVFYNGSRLTTKYGNKKSTAVYNRKGVGDGS